MPSSSDAINDITTLAIIDDASPADITDYAEYVSRLQDPAEIHVLQTALNQAKQRVINTKLQQYPVGQDVVFVLDKKTKKVCQGTVVRHLTKNLRVRYYVEKLVELRDILNVVEILDQ